MEENMNNSTVEKLPPIAKVSLEKEIEEIIGEKEGDEENADTNLVI